MKAELLYSAEQAYDSEPAVAALWDGALVQAYWRGSGVVSWGGSAGTIEWSNFAPSRPDGMGLPAVSGVIRVDGRSRPVLFQLSGFAHPPDRAGRRLISASVRWWTDDPDLQYLNDVVGFEEAEFDPEIGRITSRAYVLHPEA
jgi:hypothetical protein